MTVYFLVLDCKGDTVPVLSTHIPAPWGGMMNAKADRQQQDSMYSKMTRQCNGGTIRMNSQQQLKMTGCLNCRFTLGVHHLEWWFLRWEQVWNSTPHRHLHHLLILRVSVSTSHGKDYHL